MNDIENGAVMETEAAPEKSKDWELDAAARVRIAEALAEIDQMQSGYPTCAVCGQRCIRLDRFGTCSKVSERSEPHRQHRNEFRTGVRA